MLQIEIVKQPDGAGVLRCVRQDGSVTWQKQTRHAAHFALHDLTHYAVETALGYRRGFFGLIAEGWDVDDTTGKGARGAYACGKSGLLPPYPSTRPRRSVAGYSGCGFLCRPTRKNSSP